MRVAIDQLVCRLEIGGELLGEQSIVGRRFCDDFRIGVGGAQGTEPAFECKPPPQAGFIDISGACAIGRSRPTTISISRRVFSASIRRNTDSTMVEQQDEPGKAEIWAPMVGRNARIVRARDAGEVTEDRSSFFIDALGFDKAEFDLVLMIEFREYNCAHRDKCSGQAGGVNRTLSAPQFRIA